MLQHWRRTAFFSQINSATLCPFSPVHMTVMSKRTTSRSASSSRVRRCSTVQASQPLWHSICSFPASSTPSRVHSRARPLTTGLCPTSVTPPPTCRLLTAPPKPSHPRWIQSLTFPTGLTKSACTTPALLHALRDDGFVEVWPFWWMWWSVSLEYDRIYQQEEKEEVLVFNLKRLV